MAVTRPKTQYAKSGDVNIAYQVVGDGPLDLVMVPGFVSNVEYWWEIPGMPQIFERLGSFSRLILFDKRGTGLSDPDHRGPDPRAAHGRRACGDGCGRLGARGAVGASPKGGPMSLLFAATYPERTISLVLYGTTPKFSRRAGLAVGIAVRERRCWTKSRPHGATAT